MRIIIHELVKVISTPALIGFILICLALNIMLAVSGRDRYTDYIADVSQTTGYVMGPEFDERVSNLPAGEHAAILRMHTNGMTDVFDGYTTGYIAEAYIARLELTGAVADLMREKYAKLQYAADEKLQSGEGMTLYFAGATYYRHTQLFRVIMGVLLAQGMLLSALIMLLSLGYEFSAKTELVVYFTKKGRRLNHSKLIASIAASFLLYGVIVGVTLAVYLILNPFGGTWGSSVSSGFNFVTDLLAGARPFITWRSFSIGGYLAASVGLTFTLSLCFALMAYIAGLGTRNSYIGFIVVALVNFANVAIPPGQVFGVSLPTFIFSHSPIWLAIQQGWWFTDGGSNYLWPHFEVITIVGSLTLLTALSFFSWRQFRRRNLS